MVVPSIDRRLPMPRRCSAVLLAAAILVFGASSALADPIEPVKGVMAIAERMWSDPPSTDEYYFDAKNLSQFYSTGFIEAFGIAQKNPAIPVEDGGSEGYPFDYDVITSSQDGCPLKDIKIEAGAADGGAIPVTVTFRLWDCLEDAAERERLNELRFMVVSENGRPVIADIIRIEEGEGQSLVEEMREMGSPALGEIE
jgi:hypothetical protein